jgi:hypothetical protein
VSNLETTGEEKKERMQQCSGSLKFLRISGFHTIVVVDRLRFDADPDQDPNFHSVADPDPHPTLKLTHVGNPEFLNFLE